MKIAGGLLFSKILPMKYTLDAHSYREMRIFNVYMTIKLYFSSWIGRASNYDASCLWFDLRHKQNSFKNLRVSS